jgi:hypothetical protein
MNQHPARFFVNGLAVLSILAAGACTPMPTAARSTSTAGAEAVAGGCAGTVVTEAEPPVWAQAGFNQVKGTPWSLPWALGSGGQAVAFLFARQLVAGSGPRIDGTDNKVLWVAKGIPSNFVVDGIPPGGTQAVVTVNGGPSIVDVPSAGCWKFRLTWGAAQAESTINLDVLAAGSTPPAQTA